MVIIFHLLSKNNKLKLPEAARPDEVGRTNDPNYCLFHRMVHHPTSRCFTLKDKIQALIEVRVLTLKSKQKKVTANMVSFKFWSFPKTTVQDGLTSIPKGEMIVNDTSSEEKKSKGLILVTLKSGEVMWVHHDVVSDKQ